MSIKTEELATTLEKFNTCFEILKEVDKDTLMETMNEVSFDHAWDFRELVEMIGVEE